MVSPCLTPLLILIFSLYLCIILCYWAVRVYRSGFLYTHFLFLVLEMITRLFGFVLSLIPSSNTRMLFRVVCCIRDTSLWVSLWHVCDLSCHMLLNPASGWRVCTYFKAIKLVCCSRCLFYSLYLKNITIMCLLPCFRDVLLCYALSVQRGQQWFHLLLSMFHC